MRDVLGLNLGCGKVDNFVGKTLKKVGREVLADGSPPPKKIFFGVFFHFCLCQVLMWHSTKNPFAD